MPRCIPTGEHRSRVNAIRAYVAQCPSADARTIAVAVGCTVRQAHMALAQDRLRPRKSTPPGWRKKTPAERMRMKRARLRRKGLCVNDCGEKRLPDKDQCRPCLDYMRDRVAACRARKKAS